jgi:hypothetical protein
MEEIRASYERLLAKAAECELISNLATDHQTRADFRRQAEELKHDAERVRDLILH